MGCLGYLKFPKRLGGLGFRDVQLFNQALLAKIVWRLITKPNCLLARVLLGNYCTKTSLLKVPSSPSSSHGWKGVLWGRDLLLNHLGKAIGNGESTRVWADSWVSPTVDIKPLGPIQLKDQDLLVSDLLSRETKEWNKHLVENTLPHLAELILSIRPNILGTEDSFIWTQHPSGIYSAKSGYYSFILSKIQSTSDLMIRDTWNWEKNIWCPPLLPKIKFFLWKCARNALLTRDDLQRRNITTDASCLRCGEQETLLHLLFHCLFAVEI